MPDSELAVGRASAKLVAPALPGCLDDVHDLIESLWPRVPDVTMQERIRFETAVIEVAGNVVEHAAPVAGRSAIVTLEVSLAGARDLLQAVLIDDAEPLCDAPADATMPDADAESGRGLALTQAFVDELEYSRDGENNRWSLIIRRR